MIDRSHHVFPSPARPAVSAPRPQPTSSTAVARLGGGTGIEVAIRTSFAAGRLQRSRTAIGLGVDPPGAEPVLANSLAAPGAPPGRVALVAHALGGLAVVLVAVDAFVAWLRMPRPSQQASR